MRAEELRAELTAAAGEVPNWPQPVAREVERRVRRAAVVKVAGAVAAITAVAGAIVLGPQAVHRSAPASVATTVVASQPGTAGRLVIPGVSGPIAVVGVGELAIHDPQTGDRAITPVARLNGATATTTAIAVGPWLVVATGG